jgi:hypothetical protein
MCLPMGKLTARQVCTADGGYCISTCQSCQQVKPSNAKPIGLLRPLPTPQRNWELASLDLTIGLLTSKEGGANAAVTFVDRCSKMVHAVAAKGTVAVEQLVDIFVYNVFCLRGMPRRIVLDRDPRFTAVFWCELFHRMGTRLDMSTAYHPETDGQTAPEGQQVNHGGCAYVRVYKAE